MKSINMGTVWDRATEFLGDNIAVVLPIALGLVFLPASITDSLSPLGETGSAMQLPISVVNLALSLVSLLGQLAIIALALELAGTSGGAVRAGALVLFHAFVYSLAFAVGWVLALVPAALPFVLSGGGSAAWAAGDQATIAAAIARMPSGVRLGVTLYLLVVIPFALWLSARLMLGFPTLLAERRGLRAFGRSFALTKGLALKIIGVLILYLIVSGVAALAAKAAFGGIIRLLVGDSGPMSLGMVLTSIAVGAVGMIFSVLQAAFVAKLYAAARRRAQEDTVSQ